MLNGEKPQSSVEPSRSLGIYRAARNWIKPAVPPRPGVWALAAQDSPLVSRMTDGPNLPLSSHCLMPTQTAQSAGQGAIRPLVDAVAPRAPCGALRCDRQ